MTDGESKVPLSSRWRDYCWLEDCYGCGRRLGVAEIEKLEAENARLRKGISRALTYLNDEACEEVLCDVQGLMVGFDKPKPWKEKTDEI